MVLDHGIGRLVWAGEGTSKEVPRGFLSQLTRERSKSPDPLKVSESGLYGPKRPFITRNACSTAERTEAFPASSGRPAAVTLPKTA